MNVHQIPVKIMEPAWISLLTTTALANLGIKERTVRMVRNNQ